MKKVKEIERENRSREKWVWASWRQWLIALAVTAAVVAADQISKTLVSANLEIGEAVWLIRPFLKITLAHNPFGVFSLNFGPRFVYLLLPLLAVALVIVFLLRKRKAFVTVMLGLILGGAGNVIDRIRLGYVVDWIRLGIPGWRWGTFNISDASLIVAVVTLLVYELFFNRPEKSRTVQGKE
jgi:signal peptidase II